MHQGGPFTLSSHRLDPLIDGIFAVALTVLVLEVKVPELNDPGSARELLIAVGATIPLVTAYFVSFALLGLFWVWHHGLKDKIRQIDGVNLDELTWQEAHRRFQGKDEPTFEPDFEWRDKQVAAVAQTLSDAFGGQFKRQPEVFWEAVRKYDSNLIDYFLFSHGIDPEDFHTDEPESPEAYNDF